jgi:hypothetical protein
MFVAIPECKEGQCLVRGGARREILGSTQSQTVVVILLIDPAGVHKHEAKVTQ